MPIVRYGYSQRPNKDSHARAKAREHVIGLALLQPHAACERIEADHITPISAEGRDELHQAETPQTPQTQRTGGTDANAS